MKITDRISNVLGLGNRRSLPPPEYLLITDGLMVTTTQAIAWFEVGTSNTDEATQEHVDAELDDVVASVPGILADLDCHLKIIWGRQDGSQYIESLNAEPTVIDFEHADWLDEFDVAERHVLLGVVIDGQRQGDAKVLNRQRAATAFGVPGGKLAAAEERYYHGKVRQVGKALNGTPWNVQLADVETIMWAVSRETHRETILPRSGTVTGASLATLTGGRVVPYSDHLVTVGPDGQITRHVAVLSLADFPTEIVTGGSQEWLRLLSLIQRVDSDGNTVSVLADASIRFRFLGPAAALKRVHAARDLAKEQRQSASRHSTGETSLEIERTEAAMEEVAAAMSQEGLQLVEAHPRLVLSEPTETELQDSIEATRSHYRRMGITAYVGADEQRELWLEQMAGDQMRVMDLFQVMEAPAFFGSWFWGGAAAGEAGAPMVAFLTGSTPGLYRYSIKSGSLRGDTTTTAIIGRSGRGKTTLMMILELDAAADRKTAVYHVSIKGDDLAHVEFARSRGIDSGLVCFDASHSGCADLFRSLPSEEAVTAVATQLELLAPMHLRSAAAGVGIMETQAEAERAERDGDSPSTYRVLQALAKSSSDAAQELGLTLLAQAKTHLGAPVLGPWTGADALVAEPGLWVLKLPNLSLPSKERSQASWTADHRLSVAVVRAISLHCIAVSRNVKLREMQKVVAIPEVHRLTASEDGADFLDQLSRMGRALGANLVIDTQDATSLETMTGVLEQIRGFFCFQLLSPAQQDAAARILGLEPCEESRQTLRSLADNPDNPEDPRKGHALVRDHRLRNAKIQAVLVNEETRIALGTNPDSDRLRAEYAARIADGLNEPAPDIEAYQAHNEQEEELDDDAA